MLITMGMFGGIKVLWGKPPTTTVTNPTTQSATTPKKVLIVEDDMVMANALELKFQHEGFIVFKAPDGKVGVDMTVANKPDLILLDLQMPVMDGKTMLRNIRAIPEFKTLPVIVLTNAGDVDNIRETQTYYNANSFLIKSNVNPDAIVAKAREYL